jgi:Xaa-Pro aminopeptidase
MSYAEKIDRLRQDLIRRGAAGALLTTTDNIFYTTGFTSVMDGWHLIEPIAAVFVPAASTSPVTLFLPEASIISLITAEQSGYPVFYEALRTYDMLNFCETARATDAYAQLPPDITSVLATITHKVQGGCAQNIVQGLAQCLLDGGLTEQTILFDDLRVAHHIQRQTGQHWDDALPTMMAARSIKTAEEITLFKASGALADRVIDHTVSQLGVGTRWSEVEKSVAKFMIDHDIDPLPGSPMLFGGAYDMVFKPDLFRTQYDHPFQEGDIVILETQGRYKGFWIDINRTAHIGRASTAYREQHEVLMDIYSVLVDRLRPGANSAELARTDNIAATAKLDAPGKLLVVAHSVGHVPLESPVAYPGTGWHGAKDGFTIEENMIISIDCLYFGSKLGPSHFENVFVVTATGPQSLYQTPLDLIEVY